MTTTPFQVQDLRTEVSQNSRGVVKRAGQLLGTNSNDDASAGYVGEYKEVKIVANTNVGASATYFDAASLILSAGDWDVSGHIYYTRQGATFTASASSPDLEAIIGGASGNSSTGLSGGINVAAFVGPSLSNTFSNISIHTGPIRVQSDGTNIIIAGTTFPASQTVYLKGYVAAYSAGTPQYCCLMRARRVR